MQGYTVHTITHDEHTYEKTYLNAVLIPNHYSMAMHLARVNA